jgi:hypothetical protein
MKRPLPVATRRWGWAHLALLLAACARDPAPPSPASSASARASVAATPDPPRRPAKRWFMSRTPARCEVYAVNAEGEAVFAVEPAPCPRYLEVGERIRIAGKTCMREGSPDPARLVPVVCPDPLTAAEAADRERAR